MASKDKDFKYNIEDVFGVVKENPSSGWCKMVMKMQWGDNPSTVDIRQMKMSEDNTICGKGISLSNEETDKLVKLLLDRGYGTIEDLETALQKKKDFFTTSNDKKDNDDMLIIDINI